MGSLPNNFRALLIAGTRPEAIKMAPVIKECQKADSGIEPIICFTGQHKEMLAQVADYFEIEEDTNLNLMKPNQSLAGLTARCLETLDETIQKYQPDCIVAQGDTTTVMGASMVAFYRQLPFVHVEAGLRTGNMYSPWPEEYNRRVAGLTASLHCAPTQRSAQNLLKEGTPQHQVHITGNTVIDSLKWAVERERKNSSTWEQEYYFLGNQEMVLITGHRRENFGNKFESFCMAIKDLAERFPKTAFVYPVHLNPNVREPVKRMLGGNTNIHLCEPAIYPAFVWLMDRSKLIISDSGGVQEEAPSLGKPVLVTRDTTERPEAVDAGAVELVGTSREKIVESATLLLENKQEYAKRQIDKNPYGDGLAAQRIISLMKSEIRDKQHSQSKAA